MEGVSTIFRYLKSSRKRRIPYKKVDELQIKGYLDSD